MFSKKYINQCPTNMMLAVHQWSAEVLLVGFMVAHVFNMCEVGVFVTCHKGEK
jgi:hypothetical protein